jgi:hypothetical protein
MPRPYGLCPARERGKQRPDTLIDSGYFFLPLPIQKNQGRFGLPL